MTNGWSQAAAALLLLSTLNGCALSAGTVTVGIWRPQRQVDTVVCVQAQGDDCHKTVEVGYDSPARGFGGGMVSLFNPGYLRADGAAGLVQGVAFNSSVEYLRGRGGLALGGRVGANIATDFGRSRSKTFFSLPVSALGYWGYPAASVYAGGGYTPYATETTTVSDTSSLRRLHGFHFLGGARLLLRSARNYRISSSAELQQQHLGDLTLTTITANFGIHL